MPGGDPPFPLLSFAKRTPRMENRYFSCIAWAVPCFSVCWWSGGPRGIRSITQIQLYRFPMRLQPVACRQPQWKSWPLTAREQRVSTLTGSAVPSGTEGIWCLCGCMSVCVCGGVQVWACWEYWKVLDMLYASGHVKWHSVCHTAKWEWLTFILARECLVLHISAEELF